MTVTTERDTNKTSLTMALTYRLDRASMPHSAGTEHPGRAQQSLCIEKTDLGVQGSQSTAEERAAQRESSGGLQRMPLSRSAEYQLVNACKETT